MRGPVNKKGGSGSMAGSNRKCWT